jgi:elongation factor P
VISTNQFKNGNHIEVDGTIFRVQEFQHVKPGKGPAFVRTKLKRVSDGAVIDKTFRDVLYVDDNASGIQLPASVELEVTETDPGLKGDTVSGGGEKPATLETGVTVKVPLFVNVGDRIKVQTSSGDYISRV